MEAAPPGRIKVEGELGHRARLSWQRLERYDPAFTLAGNDGWPGDREGRAILGQVLIAAALGKPSRQVDALVRGVKSHLNERGYLGQPLPAGVNDEQVMSGHSWLLRGLVAFAQDKATDPRGTADAVLARGMVEAIVKNLLLPARGAYARYPIDPQQRPHTDRADVSFVGDKAIAGWRLSSDVGCAFILLDGATAAWDLLRTPELAALIEEMIARFRQLDVVKVKAQTHATLTATRALLRWSQLNGKPDLIPVAESLFATYAAHAMTDHFANDNWFGRPQWTEGCAIIDSYDAAMELWRLTGKPAHLEMAQHIYWNGIGYNQRPSGGFGCDTCPGSDGKAILAPHKTMFEAFACCSMRGAEGLAHAVGHAFFVAGSRVVLPGFVDAEATLRVGDGEVTLRESTGYPFAGQVKLQVVKSTSRAVLHVGFFLPSWVDRGAARLKVNQKGVDLDPAEAAAGLAMAHIEAKPGTTIDLTFPVGLRKVVALNAAKLPAHHGFRHGPLVLGVSAADVAPPKMPGEASLWKSSGRGVWKSPDGKAALRPVTGLAFLTEAQAKAQEWRILFPD